MTRNWPRLTLNRQDWVDAYEHGWTQLAALLTEGEWVAVDHLPWLLYCARYKWQQWPIHRALDFVYTKNLWGKVPSAWLELELFHLTGHGDRLHRFRSRLGADDPLHETGEDDALTRAVAAEALIEINSLLGQALPKQSAPGWPLPSLEDLGEESTLTTDAWIERCLLWLALLRWEGESYMHHRLAQMAVERCVAQPDLHRYLPPLLLDGVLGCLPAGHEASLSWWLLADPPIGVEHYPLGDASLSLHATQESGEGTRISVQTSAPLTLEIVSAKRSYVEFLSAGTHEMILTVLDRTDVR